MKCPFCNAEMENGKTMFIVSGNMTLTYTSDEEAKKGFFKRKTIQKIIHTCQETQTFYCSDCKKIIPVFDEK